MPQPGDSVSLTEHYLSWGSLVAAVTALIAVIRFWIDVGRQYQRISVTESTIAMAIAKCELLGQNLVDFRVSAATEYITNRELEDFAKRIESRLDQVMEQNARQHEATTARLDQVFSTRQQ